MKKKIAILGSTGSIGESTLDIVRRDKQNFEVSLLTAKNNYTKLLNQALEFNVKNILIYNDKHIDYLKQKLKSRKTNIFSKNMKLNRILNKKIDYTMSAISGLDGLKPTLEAIEFSKTIGIANKESIICGWYLINKKLKKYNTQFIPIDSEHFSIWNLTKEYSNEDIEEIILTASGGPFLNSSVKELKKIKPKDAVKHPNWNMGKKISVDSANLMNKVFEVIEAYRIFGFDLEKYKILVHPQSYVHAIIKFKNGLIKMLLHDTDMKIPIFNSIYNNKLKYINSKKIDPKILNNLQFYKVDKLRFPSIQLLKKVSRESSLYDTVLISANDELVNLFLQNKITFKEIVNKLIKILNSKQYKKFFSKKPNSLNKIYKVNELVRLKTSGLSV
tara:strand:- start:44 stop:1207 length:1164 start_codon:yes stop_codon:yes gene_type:complete